MVKLKFSGCGWDISDSIRRFTFPGGERFIQLPANTPEFAETVEILADLRSSNDIMDLFLTVDAVRETYPECHNIYLTMPYVPYARQDRVMTTGEPLSIRVFAKMLNSLNLTMVTVSDPHSDVAAALIDRCYVVKQHELFRDFCSRYDSPEFDRDSIILAPDAGAQKKLYGHYRNKIFTAEKHRDPATGKITGCSVPTEVLDTNAPVWIIDDICDGGKTFTSLVEAATLANNGVKPNNWHLYVTHGIFSKGKDLLLEYFTTVNAYYDWTQQ